MSDTTAAPVVKATDPKRRSGSVERLFVEAGGLRSLVGHQVSVDGQESMERVHRGLKSHDQEFVGVIENGCLAGVVSRTSISEVLSGRYGFPLFSNNLILDHLLENALIVREDTPLLELLKLALNERSGVAFHQDVALIDQQGAYLGMIQTERLTKLQWELLQEEKEESERHWANLEQRNQDLFRSLEDLRRSQARYRMLFENEALGVALLDPKGQTVAVNSRFHDLTDLRPQEGELLGLIEHLDGHRHGEFESMLSSAEESSREYLFHFPKLGSRILRVHHALIPETGQQALLLDDLTHQRELEKRMAQSEKSVLLDSLAGGVAHELNNKLAPIMGLSQFLRESVRSMPVADLQNYLGTIESSARDAAGIIRQLLDLSKPPAPEMSAQDINKLVEGSLDILRFELRQASCKLHFDGMEKTCSVSVDPAQFRQVMINLVLNARNALEDCERKEVWVEVDLEGNSVVISVTDTGCGMDEETVQRIFDPFVTNRRDDGGSGLGLSVSFHIVRAHNGEISVSSREGEGTTVQVRLPLSESDCCEAQTSVLDGGQLLNGLDSGQEGNNLRILIVDDEPFIIRFLTDLLGRNERLFCETATGVEEAIEKLGQNSYHLIISDVRMPGLDGFALLSWIKGQRPDLARRFVFITGDAGGSEMNRRLDEMPIPVVRKPFVIDELTAECFRLLGDRGLSLSG